MEIGRWKNQHAARAYVDTALMGLIEMYLLNTPLLKDACGYIFQQFLFDFQSEQLGECASTATPFGLVRLFAMWTGEFSSISLASSLASSGFLAMWTGEFFEYSDF